MDQRAAIQQLIERSYAARDSGDLEALMATFHDDTNLRLAGRAKGWPGETKAVGKAAVRALMAQLMQDFEFKRRHIEHVLIDGDVAVVHSDASVLHKPTGQVIDTEIIDLFTYADGGWTSFHEFLDTALILQTVPWQA